MAEVAMETIPKRAFTCEQCGHSFPRWRNGKTVPSNTRFCSDSCAGKARRRAAKIDRAAPIGQTGNIAPGSAQKRPSNGLSCEEVKSPSVTHEGTAVA
jgi:hypothetical protein